MYKLDRVELSRGGLWLLGGPPTPTISFLFPSQYLSHCHVQKDGKKIAGPGIMLFNRAKGRMDCLNRFFILFRLRNPISQNGSWCINGQESIRIPDYHTHTDSGACHFILTVMTASSHNLTSSWPTIPAIIPWPIFAWPAAGLSLLF